jgi:hypothetical protein
VLVVATVTRIALVSSGCDPPLARLHLLPPP